MSDSNFSLVGKLIRLEDFYGEPSIGEPAAMKEANDIAGKSSDERLYATFVVISDKPEMGGVHQIVATPNAANAAYYCIQQGLMGIVTGHIRTFNRETLLIATWVTSMEPNTTITREHYPGVKGWKLEDEYPKKAIYLNA